jgi:hypothetical protein
MTDGMTPEGEIARGLAVTYSTSEVPPRTLFIPGENITDAQVADAIRKDLQAHPPSPPATLTI